MRYHDHNLEICKRCGETDRAKLLRGKCIKAMSRGGRIAFLRGVRPDVLFVIKNCGACGAPFYRIVIDTRMLCYGCA